MDLSDEILIRKNFHPLLRFKVAVWTVITNLCWLNDDDFLLTSMKPSLLNLKVHEILNELYKISVFHKLIFFKTPSQRTSFEMESIMSVLLGPGFKCFKLFRNEIKIALMSRTTYKCYKPGKWILKEGHIPENMYLIIKGHVRVTESIYNPMTKSIDTIEHRKSNAGKSFGESAVMFNSRRITSVQSLDTVELIALSQKDFTDILKDNFQQNWKANAIAIKKFVYFKYFRLMELNKCSIISFVKIFKPKEYVLGDGLGNLNYAHFVIEGKISLIYRLKKIYNSVTNLGKISAKSNKIIKYSHKYLEICTFSSNACFNIGENIDNKEFMATGLTITKCLCVPMWFLRISEKLNNWTLLKLDVNNRLQQHIPNICSMPKSTT